MKHGKLYSDKYSPTGYQTGILISGKLIEWGLYIIIGLAILYFAGLIKF